MKVSSSPFEASTGTVREGSGSDRAGETAGKVRSASSENLVSPPAATSHVRAGLDPATRESLSRLVALARAQVEEEKAESTENSRRAESEEASDSSAKPVLQLSPIDVRGARLSRLQKSFADANRRRGREAYRQAARQKVYADVEAALAANSATASSEGLADDFLEGLFSDDATDLDSVQNLETLDISQSSERKTKRVA